MIRKKLAKLFVNPNLFFYDLFKKRVFKNQFLRGASESDNTVELFKRDEKEIYGVSGVDILEIHRNGVLEYFNKVLNGAYSPEDGIDKNSMLIWSGYLRVLLEFINDLKKSMSMSITIYTMGGGFNYSVSESVSFNVSMVESKLKNRPDFVVEISNNLGYIDIFHFYFFDINSENLVQVRSSQALIKKCRVEELSLIFNSHVNSYEKIDAVYTWVNQADPQWQLQWMESFPEEAFDRDRYTCNEELKYSLRSLSKYAPWLNHIYIVSNCAKPQWLSSHHKITWVDHSNIFPEKEMLPTFNSHAIECCLHNIEGLEERFIYLNDDFILAQPCLPKDFFDESGRSVSYFESYGMVYPNTIRKDLPDYLRASVNSFNVLKKKYCNYNPRNLHRHVPYAMKKSVLKEIENEFPDEINFTRYSKIRSDTDINLTSFFYHHYAYINGDSVRADLNSLIVRPENIKTLLERDCYKYKILCFNDGGGSSTNIEYKRDTLNFFKLRLSDKASWEF